MRHDVIRVGGSRLFINAPALMAGAFGPNHIFGASYTMFTSAFFFFRLHNNGGQY